jgi:hypothetical protein
MTSLPQRSLLQGNSGIVREETRSRYDTTGWFSDSDEEDAAERALSERYGEASEAKDRSNGTANTQSTTSPTAGGVNAQEIAALYDKGVTVKPKRRRVTLEETHLTGADGLIRLPHDLSAALHYRPPPHKRDVPTAAAYSRRLMRGYEQWFQQLVPSTATDDAALKTSSLGAKKSVKAFVETMRHAVRNQHLERIYGRERADAMLVELEHGLRQQQEVTSGDEPYIEADDDGQRAKPPVTRQTIPDATTFTSSRDQDNHQIKNHNVTGSPVAMNRNDTTGERRRILDDDSDEEHEATFADDHDQTTEALEQQSSGKGRTMDEAKLRMNNHNDSVSGDQNDEVVAAGGHHKSSDALPHQRSLSTTEVSVGTQDSETMTIIPTMTMASQSDESNN